MRPSGADLVGDLLPIIQAAHSSPFDRADMDEHIGAAGVGGMNPMPFVALNHFTVPVAMAAPLELIDEPSRAEIHCKAQP